MQIRCMDLAHGVNRILNGDMIVSSLKKVSSSYVNKDAGVVRVEMLLDCGHRVSVFIDLKEIDNNG